MVVLFLYFRIMKVGGFVGSFFFEVFFLLDNFLLNGFWNE